MLKMRLQRIGRKNNPSYRVLIVDSRQGPKSGKFVDIIGSYDPKIDRVALDGEKARDWIAKGVQASPTVHNLLISQKIIEGKKINVLPRKTPPVKEGEEVTAEAPAAPAEVVVEETATTPEAETPVDAPAETEVAPEATEEAPATPEEEKVNA